MCSEQISVTLKNLTFHIICIMGAGYFIVTSYGLEICVSNPVSDKKY